VTPAERNRIDRAAIYFMAHKMGFPRVNTLEAPLARQIFGNLSRFAREQVELDRRKRGKDKETET
jgi:hypothetical protein